MTKKILYLLFTLPLITYAAEPIDKIAAVVNDQVITQAELTEAIDAVNSDAATQGSKLSSQEAQKKALDNLIDRTLQLQIASMNKISASDDEVNAALAQVAQEHQIPLDQLPAALAQQGLTLDKFKSQLKEQLTLQDFQRQELAGNINITPQEVDAEVKKLKAQPLQTQVLYHFEDILIPLPVQPSQTNIVAAKQAFDAIAKAIDAKKDFDKIGQEVTGTPPQDLGWRTKEQLPPEFGKILSKLQEGQVAPPVRSPTGIHILKLIQVKTLAAASDLNDTVTETHVRHILLKSDALTPKNTLERRLLGIRDAIVHGADFAKMAQENSQDPGSVADGGDLGWVKPETLDPKFEAAMDKLKVNDISQPVQTQFGWHLIQVLGRRQIQDPETALKVKAQQIVFQQKMDEAVKQMISQLKAQAYIKIYAK